MYCISTPPSTMNYIQNLISPLLLYLFTEFFIKTIYCSDVKPQKEIYLPDYNIYHNVTSIYTILSSLKHHDCVHINKTYKSRQLQSQYILRFTNFTNERVKPRILIVTGQHAREFFPVESVLSLVLNITSGLEAKSGTYEHRFSKFVVNHLDLYVVPLLNPDGKRYLESRSNYCWRGTATGVDLERNFDWSYGGSGSSSNVDDEEYRGTGPFSEPECQILLDLTQNFQFDGFLSLHSGIRQIYIPFSDSKSRKLVRRPDNVVNMLNLAAILSKAPPGDKFVYGLAHELNAYSADGTIFDYMAGVRQIPFSLTLEMWGEGKDGISSCFDQFNPPSSDLKSAINNVHHVYEALFLYMVRWKKDQIRRNGYLMLRHDEPSLTLGLVLLGCVVCVTLFYTVQHKLPFWMHVFPRRRIVSLRTLSSTFYPYKLANSD